MFSNLRLLLFQKLLFLLHLLDILHNICLVLIHSFSMAPPSDSETNEIVEMTSSLSKVHSLKAAIFHTTAFKLSLEINKNKVTLKTLNAFLKVLYNVSNIKKKQITFSQYSRIHHDGPKIAICETASNMVFVLNSSFTTKDHYFHHAVQEAIQAFNSTLEHFGYNRPLEMYDSLLHQSHPPAQHPLYK